MRIAAAIAALEVRRIFRDRLSLLFVIVLPVLIIGLVGSDSFDEEAGIPIGLFVAADGPAADALRDADTIDLRDYDSRTDLDVAVRLEDVAGGAVVDGRSVTLVIDPATADATSTRTLVQGIVAEESTIIGIAERYDLDVDDVRSAAAGIGQAAVQRTTLGAEAAAGDVDAGDFSYTAPAMLVLFTFLNSLTVGGALTAAKPLGIFTRWRAAPVREREMVAGLLASRTLFAAVQAALILVVGTTMFDVDWGDPLAVALLTGLFVLVGTAVSVISGLVATTPRQTDAIGVPVGIGLGMLGGCMWSLDVVPDAMRVVGHATPHAWAVDGFRALVFDGASVGDIAGELGVLVGFVIVLWLVAVRVARTRLV